MKYKQNNQSDVMLEAPDLHYFLCQNKLKQTNFL